MSSRQQILISISVLLLLAHAWMVLGHRQKMGSDPKDQPQDPLYRKSTAMLSFGSMILIQCLAFYRWLNIELESWNTESALHKLLDFLPLPFDDKTFIIGTLIFISGFTLRLWAIQILGRLFTFEIGIRAEHKIIEEGPYHLIRHPSYTGYLLMLLGIGIAYASLFAVIAQVFGTLTFFYLRMNSEEAMLLKSFGESYRSYMQRTKRLIPFIY